MHSLIDSLFKQPFINAKDVQEILRISQPAAWNLLEKLKKKGILKKEKISGRESVYYAHEILDILESVS